ncbi:flagellar motor switch protein FliY [Hydrogenimonas cancrithermarum]|uniref:Flagellar motor switch protein FliN n=1 Tax=Hydrogenimonas cancrithermarum TaxID=2993563 RepID=A0ABN6WU94_9BACT|nr:flagellar motor switch protein FliY [Hydrogenimonas cancrithermarum]BDY12528.1 flagellar motor switch protein FliY [Hydrogenimonas cancrithermarum]
MADWIELLARETAATIEGLTGQRPDVKFKEKEPVTDIPNVIAPMSLVTIRVTGELNGKMAIAISPMLGTALSDMMLGGEGESKPTMDSDDLDAVKEIVSNIFGALATAMKAQKEFPELSFEVTEIKFYEEGEDIDISEYATLLAYNFSLGVINGIFMTLLDENLMPLVDKEDASRPSASAAPATPAVPASETSETVPVDQSEMKNIGLILDVKLPLRVRIGSKKMLLKDVLSMDIGSVIELDQLANDPLEILVDDKVIAYGEVVIVDGNFGVQITHIGSKRDRLETLKS